MSAFISMIGCGLVLAGFAIEKFAEHRWLSAGRPGPLDALTVLSLVLPLAGLAVIGTRSI